MMIEHNHAKSQGKRTPAALLLSLFVFFAVSTVSLMVAAPAKAIPVEETASVPEAKNEVDDVITNTLVEAAVSSVVNGVNYFATQMAYNAAIALTTSCPGQVTCWNSKSIGQSFKESWQGAIGETVGTLSEESGLEELGFDLCNPGLSITLKIQLGLLNQVKPKPRCDYGQIVGSWETLVTQYTSGQALQAMKNVFEPGQSPLSASLVAFSGANEARITAQQNEQMRQITEAAGGGGFSPVVDPVSGRVKSPAFVTQRQYDSMTEAQQRDAPERITQLSAGQIASRSVTTVVLNTVNVFTATLVSGLWNRLAQGLLSTEELVANQPDLVLNPDALLQPPGITGQESIQATRNRIAPTRDAGLIDPLLEFSTCPAGARGPKNCVIDQQFASAVRVADATPFTVEEAIKQGMLHGDWPMVSASDTARNQDPYCYTQGYCESNLKKLRAARIIPIGWEIAAAENNGVTLQAVVDGFDDCNEDGLKDDTHPFCKLIDPDWVLRAPAAQCRAVGYGEQLVSSAIPTRAEVCLDTQTCLAQDDNGNCVGGWGYCTREQNVWRFNADQCPAQFNTCRVLKARNGDSRAYNVNTIDHGVCNADNVGCREYATTLNVFDCELALTGRSDAPNGVCNVAGGCLCRPPAANVCTVGLDQSSCTNVSTGQICDLNRTCRDAAGCACASESVCRVNRGEHSCSTTSGDALADGDDWLSSPSRFFNASAPTCNGTDAGCTALVRLGAGQSLNLIRNGSFEELEDGDADGNFDHARYWTPFGDVPAGAFGSLVKDGSSAVAGSNSLVLSGTAAASASCALASNATCNNVNGCECTTGNYSCKVALGLQRCTVTGRVMQDGIELSKDTTYTVSLAARPTTGSTAGGKVSIVAYNRNGARIALSGANFASTTAVTGNTGSPTATCSVPSSGADAGNVTFTFSGTVAGNSAPLMGSCTFVITGGDVASAHLELLSNGGAFVDNVQLEEGGGSSYHDGYGDTLGNVNAKVAPAYLGCTGETTDRQECRSFAGVCRESEVGCDSYTPTNGDPFVPGIVSQRDLCPAQCAGYDTFKQEPSEFESSDIRVAFIPSTARACTANEVGCSEFTNTVTEERSYFSSLRLCVQPNDTTVRTFYSWEGSDTTGYQLRTWSLKATTTTGNAVANVADNGTNDICAVTGCLNAGPAPCTKLRDGAVRCDSRNVSLASGSTAGLCSRADIDAGNLDCREFYDAAGNRHYRLLSKTIIASEQCFNYRITTSNQNDCEDSGGRWNSSATECIYSADLGQSNSCAATYNGCRAYKGNAATNVRTVLFEDFESGIGRWRDNGDVNSVNFNQSAEAVVVGGHSVRLMYNSGIATNRFISAEVGDVVEPNRSYSLTYWARGSGVITASFRDGKVAQPDLPIPSPATAQQFFEPRNAVVGAEWKQYSIGPVIVNAANWGQGTTRLVLQAQGVCAGNPATNGTACTASSTCGGGGTCAQAEVYVDNIQLKEVQDSIYVVRDSWRTPAACDQTADGTSSPQEMLGCKEYRKGDGSQVFLRSFSRLCRDQAIGCSAYSHTQNTPTNPNPETYNAVCSLASACTTGPSCVCNYDTRHPAAVSGASVMLPDVCRVAVGESTCRFKYDGIDDLTADDRYPDRVKVGADKRVYLVVRPENMCGADAIGCTVMGQAAETFESQCTLPQINNDRRCSDSGAACTSDSQCGGSAVCAPVSRTCNVSGSTCEVPFGKNSCTVSLEQPRYDSWAATAIRDLPESYSTTLCKEEAVGCDAFSSSDGVQYFKDPGERTCQYRENVTINGRQRSGWFRKSETGSFFPCYPELLRDGTQYEIYKNADPTCSLSSACTAAGGCTCAIDGVNVCRVVQGGTTCGYQGWVGMCEPQFDRCEEFVDPVQTSDSNPDGKPYYYLMNSKLDRQTCAGSASLKQGCVMLKQTSVTSNLYSAATTYYKSQRDAGNGRVSPVNCAVGSADPACDNRCVSIPAGSCSNDDQRGCRSNADCQAGGTCEGLKRYTTACQKDSDCNVAGGETCAVGAANVPASERGNDSNIIIKVNPDRQCAEWLSCTSYDTVWDETRGQYRTVCSGFGPCRENSGTGPNSECVRPVEPQATVFTPEDYARRDVTWNGSEYSGHTVVNAFDASFLMPLNVATSVCVDPNAVTADSSGVVIGSNGRSRTCTAAADCGAGQSCRRLSGICLNAGASDGRACDAKADCGRDPAAICSYSYAATHRFAAVLDPDNICRTNADCVATSENGYPENTVCVDNRCAFNISGGAFNMDSADTAPSCRAYPEADSPYAPSVLSDAGSQYGGYNEYGSPQSKLGAFGGANVCGRGNDCACSYTRWKYGSGISQFLTYPGKTQRGPVTFNGNVDIPLSMNSNTGICVGGPYEGRACEPKRIQLGGATTDDSDPCNSEGGGTCQRLTSVTFQQGWLGYCLDPDKSMNVGGDQDKFDCNLWLPVDQLAGAPDEFNQYEEAGYRAPESQLMHCTLADGAAYGVGTTYDYVVVDESDCAGSGADCLVYTMHDGTSDDDLHNRDTAFSSLSAQQVFRDQIVAIRIEGVYQGRGNHPIGFHLTPKNGWQNGFIWSGGSGNCEEMPCDYEGENGDGDPARINRCFTQAQDDLDAACLAMRAEFSATGELVNFKTAHASDDQNAGGRFPMKVTIKLRESCLETANTYDANAVPTSFAWTDKLHQARVNPTATIRGMRGGPVTDRAGAVKPDLSPFGRIEPASIAAVLSASAGITTLNVKWPVTIANSEGGSAYTYVIDQTPAADGGVPYAYNGPNYDRNNNAIADAGGYPFACIGPCRLPESSALGAAAQLAGRQRLSELFVWPFYTYISNRGGASRDLTAANLPPIYSQQAGYDRREDFRDSGHAPRVVAVNTGNCAGGADGLCEEGQLDLTNRSGLTVNGNMGSAPVESEEPGRFRATISFYAYADPNRMPIRRKIVDFGDGDPSVSSMPSAYKNHRGCTFGQPGCGSDDNPPICGSADVWGLTTDSCEPGYFQSVHVYRCTPDRLANMPACTPNSPFYPCKGKNSAGADACIFKPRVQIMDNWGFCNGSCSGAPGGSSCFNRGNKTAGTSLFSSIRAVFDPDQGDAYTATTPNNECNDLDYQQFYNTNAGDQRPWTEFGNVIIVTP